MQESELRTTWKQRIFIIIIAIFMLGSTIALYASIVLSGEQKNQETAKNAAAAAKVQKKMADKQDELSAESKKLSDKYLNTLKQYKSRVKSYNATAVNNKGLQMIDLKAGTGAEITTSNKNYYAYYIGWCADESVNEGMSSFDDYKNPTSLGDPIDGQSNLIAGWTEGVVGMKIGGVRELHIPGELAYGDTYEICGGKNSPLKYVILAIDPGETYKKLLSEYTALYYEYQAALNGEA